MKALLSSALPEDVRAFFMHWHSARKNDVVPTLSDYLDLPPFPLQRDTAIVDVAPGGSMHYRLFGGGLNDLHGNDLTGRDVLSHFHPEARAEAQRLSQAAVSTPCGYLLQRQMRRAALEVTAKGIGLPLRNTQSGAKCIVGFTSTAAKQTGLASLEDKIFVTRVQLIGWIDIGAGTA